MKIEDSQAKTVLEVECNSPWLLAQLKPGSYTVQATADKKYPKSAKLLVGAGKSTEQAIRFPEISGD